MRNGFAKEIVELAASDARVVLLSGDIGNRMFDTYKERFPDRFYNCGVAEANMTGVAAGMALCGFRPFTYTIAAFNTVRCLEQIRFDICYPNLPVVIMGVGGGLCYASLNASHQAMEDIALLRVLPNMTVICPGDAMEVRAALRAAVTHDGPVYIRLGKKNEPVVHDEVPALTIGKALVVREGSKVCILSTGNMLPTAVDAGDRLTGEGISTRVVSFHTVKPLDEDLLEDVFARFAAVVTVEEHSILGGLGGSIAEWLSERNVRTRLIRIGSSDTFMYEAGGQTHGRRHFGLTAESIINRVHAVLA